MVVQHHATDPTYTTEYEYDDLDQLIRVTRNEDSALTIHYEYDSAGRLIRTYTGNVESTPGARAGEDDDGIAVTDTAYEYDLQGRLWKVKLYAYEDQPVTPEVTTYTYDDAGYLHTITQANGVVFDYTFDSLGRLDLLVHIDSADSHVIASFDYAYDSAGRCESVLEQFDTNDSAGFELVQSFAWAYDDLDRLTAETFDLGDDGPTVSAGDYVTKYKFDLNGNRVAKLTDHDYSGDVESMNADETIAYAYDDNGRLLTEAKDDLSQANADRYTVYHYGTNNERTEQTGKTVCQGLAPGTELEDVENEYDLAGRLAIVTIDRPGENDDETVTFAYDDDGNRVGQAVEDAEGTATTTYLIDDNNFTGYSQTLEQTDRNASSQVVKKTTYVVGADVTGQYVTADETTTGAIFLQDGHGSTRGLYATASATGALLNAALVTAGGSTWTKTLTYDAYGNAVGFDPASAKTELLYNGESFNSRTGQQYLRARWYDPASGRFGTLDPWAGDVTSPISPHKYLYASTSPVMNADPSGWASLLEKAIDIHHIVAKGAMKAGAVVARNVLLIFTIAVNSAANLVPLARGFHQHLHTIRYCNWVADLLSNAQSAEEVYEILAMIKETLRSGGPF